MGVWPLLSALRLILSQDMMTLLAHSPGQDDAARQRQAELHRAYRAATQPAPVPMERTRYGSGPRSDANTAPAPAPRQAPAPARAPAPVRRPPMNDGFPGLNGGGGMGMAAAAAADDFPSLGGGELSAALLPH